MESAVYAFLYGLLLGVAPSLLFFTLWRTTRAKLRRLEETTEDIRAWDAGYLAEESTGRHALQVVEPDPEPEPVTAPIAPGTSRTAMWYDLITDWANAHEPVVARASRPAPKPAWYTETQQQPVVGVDVTRLPQIQNLTPSASLEPVAAPVPEPLPSTTWPIWGPEPIEPGAPLWYRVAVGIRLGLVEFELSGQRINAWVAARIEHQVDRWLAPLARPKTAIRPKRSIVFSASATRWEYRGGAR